MSSELPERLRELVPPVVLHCSANLASMETRKRTRSQSDTLLSILFPARYFFLPFFFFTHYRIPRREVA